MYPSGLSISLHITVVMRSVSAPHADFPKILPNRRSQAMSTTGNHLCRKLVRIDDGDHVHRTVRQFLVLLFLDRHSCHYNDLVFIDEVKNVTVISIPPHCTHKIQPLDVNWDRWEHFFCACHREVSEGESLTRMPSLSKKVSVLLDDLNPSSKPELTVEESDIGDIWNDFRITRSR